MLTIPENRSVSAIALLAILLRTLAENPKLNSFEKETFMVLSMRCFSYAWNFPCMNVPVLSQQDKSKNSFSFSDENRNSELEGIRKVFLMDESLIGDVDPDTRKRLALLRNAYHEGRKHLTKKSLKVLNELMQRTSRDSLHNEFFATGFSDNEWISEIQKGFIKEGGLKSTNPVYDFDEDIVYHSHPDLSPLSINGDSYNKENLKGDIGHAFKGRKKVFVINTRGDIFYTNPVVVDACTDGTYRCESGLCQVFLGNIKDFQ